MYFSLKKAMEAETPDLTKQIKEAKHAGKAKVRSREVTNEFKM
jgi:hypothetical protein